MTRVKAISDGDRCALTITGHAAVGEDETGKLVCASVSGIAFALLGWLKNAELTGIGAMTHESGDVRIDVCGDARLRTAFEVAVIGLMQAAQSYPQYVTCDAADFWA